MLNFFNWNCCSSKPAEHKKHDLSFEDGASTPGITRKKSDASNTELLSGGSRAAVEQHARLLRAQALKKPGKGIAKRPDSERQSEYEANDDVAEAAHASNGG